MATEVGSLQASLTLDLSDFRAGIADAYNLAQSLGTGLSSIFNRPIFTGLLNEVSSLLDQIKALQTSMQDFSTYLTNLPSGANLFSEMRTHTAAIPGEIAAIQQAIDSIDFSRFANIPALDFSSALGQLTEMRAQVELLVAMIGQLNGIDLSTGELVGDPEQLAASLTALFSNIDAISEQFTEIETSLTELIHLSNEWADALGNVEQRARNIHGHLHTAATAEQHAARGTRDFTNNLRNSVDQSDQLRRNFQTIKGYATNIKGIIGGIVISQSFYSLLNLMEQITHGASEFSQNMQDSAVAFKYLMKDAAVSSEAFLNALKEIALRSPLDTTDLTAASRKLMAMGFSANATVPALQILTDTAAVFSNGAGEMADMIDRISLALGQMLAAGKVNGQELKQLYNAGVPVYELLAEGLDITVEQAKNIGKMSVDSSRAVYAILTQLQKRYAGASNAMAKTFSGAMQVIKESMQQIISYSWAGIFDDLTEKVNKIASFMQALVKITQAYGHGGLFQAIFPKESWTTLRMFIAGLQQVGAAAKKVGQIIIMYFGGGLKVIVQVGSYVLPILGQLANILNTVVIAALRASPTLRLLFSSIAALIIAGAIGSLILRLAKTIWSLIGAAKAAAAIKLLFNSLVGLSTGAKFAIGILAALAAVFLAVTIASEKARASIAKFLGMLGGKVNDFAESLGLGYDLSEIEAPVFNPPDTADFSAGLEELTEGMEELGDATEEAGKKAKKNLQSFDEVFTIAEDDDTFNTDALTKMMDSLEDFGKIDYSDLFDWTGDWEKDWANLTADLEGLDDDISDLPLNWFDELAGAIKNFWDTVNDGDSETGMHVIDGLATALAMLGKLPLAGALEMIKGIGEIVETIQDIAVEGLTFDNFIDMLHGLSDVVVAIGLFTKNTKILGWGLTFSGLTEIIQELQENWDAIRQGDWSGVDKATLIIGGLKILGGLALAFGAFSNIFGTANAASAAEAVGGMNAATQGMNGAFSIFNPNLTKLAANMLLVVAIIAEVVVAAGLLLAGIELFGVELQRIADAWAPLEGQGAVLGAALWAGVSMMAIVGAACLALGGVGATLVTQIAIGAAVLLEIAATTALLIAAVWALGELLQQVTASWEPVLTNSEATAQAMEQGALLLIAVGIAAGLIGAAGAGLIVNFAIGAAVIAEIGIATGLFLVEVWGIGILLQQIVEAWQPVIDNSEVAADAITQGTLLLGAVGLACAALGALTIGTAGLLPAAIAIGTAIIAELGFAFQALIEQLVLISVIIVEQLSPALIALNEVLPQVTTDLDTFIAFLSQLATSMSSYAESMGEITWSSIVTRFLTLFAGNPIEKLANDIDKIREDVLNLNTKLTAANAELEKAITLLTDYNAFMDEMKLLTQANGTVELASGMFTNLQEVGKNLVLGLIQGINDGKPQAQQAAQECGKETVEGLKQGVQDADFVSWLQTNLIQKTVQCVATNFAAARFVQFGVQIGQGIMAGISQMEPAINARVTAICNSIMARIRAALSIHSPSKKTEEVGEYLDLGMIVGLENKRKELLKAATSMAEDVLKAMSIDEDVAIDDGTLPALTALTGKLTTWSAKFIEIMQSTVDQINAMFDKLDERIDKSIARLSSLSSQIEARIGSLSEVDAIASRSNTTGTPTGTATGQVELSRSTLSTLSELIAARMYEYIAPLFATLTAAEQDRVIAYIGTLIADDSGLRELDRQLKTIQISEGRRS